MCVTITVFFDTPLFLGHMLTQSSHVLNGHSGGLNFLKIKNLIFLVKGQGQVQAQPGFQAPPGLQQVQVLRRCSPFWPENHFTW